MFQKVALTTLNGAKKAASRRKPLSEISQKEGCLLGKADSLRGANTCACTALCASIGVDGIALALGDSSNGAFINTSAACNAVFTNYVSHNNLILNG